jgi:LytR cell envelope-related transcriptional attenuator
MTGPYNADDERRGPLARASGRTAHLSVFRAVAVAAVAVVIGALLVDAVTRGPQTAATPAVTTTTAAPPPSSTTTTTTVPHASVKVVVANGTTEPNVAAHFTAQLQSAGWAMQPATDTTAPASASNVYYAAGQQAAANEIATSLGLKASAVQPLTTSVPVSGTTGVDVVVVIGPDLAGQGFPA